MSLNHKEIDAVLSELPLAGSHIQDLRQPDFRSLVLDLYRPQDRFSVLLSLNQGKTRIHRLTRRTPNREGLQRFAQFLRSTVKGGRIIEAGQVGSDRIVRLRVRKGDEEIILWVRLWGGASNIIVTNPDGTVLDAFYRRPKRGEVTGGFYKPENEKPSGRGGDFQIREFPGDGCINARIEEYYAALEAEEELFELKARALKTAGEALRTAEALCRNIENRLASSESFQKYREYGDLLTAHLYRIRRGEAWFETENYYQGNTPVRIELDPQLTPEQNAERYYKKYKKSRRGLETLRDDRENAENLRERAGKELARITESKDLAFLKDYLEEKKSEKPAFRNDPVPGLVYSSGGFTIRVGRSAKENDYLLRRWSKGNDYWIHARDWPGAYVFIRTKKDKSVPLDVLLDAGNLALHYSRGKASGRGEFYYTRVKYLRRPKDGKAGLVLPTMEKNLSVVLDQRKLDKLFSLSDIDNTKPM